jgi:tetratricopeptide (TPR) repeat protein
VIRSRLAAVGTVAALAATVLLFGGVFRDAGAAQPVAAPGTLSALEGGFAAGDTEALVRGLEQRVGDGTADAKTLTSLGFAYQQRYRETADATYLARADAVLRRARKAAPRDASVAAGLASVELSRHRFRNALVLAREAQRLAPDSARPPALLGDALVELGRYDEAFAAYDASAALRPGLTAYARVAYGRELVGDREGAIEAMELALETAPPRSEAAAWAHVELGKLFFGQGEPARAERSFRAALVAFPGYVYAYDMLAHVEAVRGNDARAVELAQTAVDRVPLPQFVTTLGDLHRAQGREQLARRQYDVMGVIQRLLSANGVRLDLETALFNVDHAVRPRETLALARRARALRPGIEGDDVLAWALARNGRCAEALTYSRSALRLGTRDALKFFHRGMIERCLGNRTEAKRWFTRALELNPNFSLLWAPLARSEVR